jgi:hypothetical protein
MDLKEKLENLEKQLKQAEVLYFKLEGAIEFVESMIKEEQESSKEEKKK